MSGFLNLLINSILSVFPSDPFQSYIVDMAEKFNPFLGMVNWFIPFRTIVVILNAWILCILVYYAWQALARFLHLIG